MACEIIGDNCPRPGDSDNILLRKILQSLLNPQPIPPSPPIAGQGVVVSGDTVSFAQSGPYTTGAIPFATSPTTMGFDPTQLFWDNTNNRLGVGTDSPGDTLHIAASNGDFQTVLIEDVSNAGLGPGLRFRNARGTLSAPTDVVNGDYVASISSQSFSGGMWFGGGEIDVAIDGAFVSGQRPPSRIEFYTNVANGGQLLRWLIKSSGEFLAGLDNTYDIGFTGASRPRTIFVGTSLQIEANQGLRLTNQTDGAGASVGTLTNAPSAGNPAFWIPITVNGATRFIPAWA